MDIQKTAQTLIDDLGKDLESKKAEIAHIEGAIKGIHLFFQKLVSEMQPNESDKVDEKAAKSNKKK